MSEDQIYLLGRHQARSSESAGLNIRTDQPAARPLKHVNFNPRHEIHAFDPENTKESNNSLSISGRLDLWTTILMSCLLLIGVGCGIAHHAFNSYLNGRLTTSFDQAWAIRIGTALAMGLKATVLASMGMAFAQQVWRTVRRSTLSVKALDSLFGAFGGDPRSLFQADLYRSARLALLLAITAWLLPIATVFTPATLRVKPMDKSASSSCLVSTIDLRNVTDGAGVTMNLVNDDPLLTGAAALIDATFDSLTGNLAQGRDGNIVSPSSNAALASFVNPSSQASFDFTNVSENVEQLMQNVVISTIGFRIFQTETTCVVVNRVNVYLYDEGVLISAYVAV
ncbi:unnamed protein product, partial [Rhizoctonia solani]